MAAELTAGVSGIAGRDLWTGLRAKSPPLLFALQPYLYRQRAVGRGITIVVGLHVALEPIRSRLCMCVSFRQGHRPPDAGLLVMRRVDEAQTDRWRRRWPRPEPLLGYSGSLSVCLFFFFFWSWPRVAVAGVTASAKPKSRWSLS